MVKKTHYPPVPFGSRVKKRIENETESLMDSIKKHTITSDYKNIRSKEDLLKFFKNTEFSFISEHASDKDTEIIWKHPIIQDRIDKGLMEEQLPNLITQIKRREPNLDRKQLMIKAKELWIYRREKSKAKGELFLETLSVRKTKKKERLKALQPSRRPEQMIHVNGYGNTKSYYRSKSIMWTDKQLNFLKANREQSSEFIIKKYNKTFPKKRTVSSILTKFRRLKRKGIL